MEYLNGIDKLQNPITLLFLERGIDELQFQQSFSWGEVINS